MEEKKITCNGFKVFLAMLALDAFLGLEGKCLSLSLSEKLLPHCPPQQYLLNHPNARAVEMKKKKLLL